MTGKGKPAEGLWRTCRVFIAVILVVVLRSSAFAEGSAQPVPVPIPVPIEARVAAIDADGNTISETTALLTGYSLDTQSSSSPILPETFNALDTVPCDLELYNNTTDEGHYSTPGAGYETLDFGTSDGGQVCHFQFAYHTTLSDPGPITIRFYSGTSAYNCPGTYIAGWTFSGLMGSGVWIVNHDITEAQRFNLPSGAFGYSYILANADTDLLICSGGAGQEDTYWKDCSPWWFGGFPEFPWSGFYMIVTGEGVSGDAEIAVSPTSMSFDCEASGASSAAMSPAGELGPENLAGIEPAAKVIEEQEIRAAFAAGQDKVDVIVSLHPPAAVVAATDFNNKQSLARLQAENAKRQNAVRATLNPAEFQARHTYRNIAAFSGSVSRAGLDKLAKNPNVLAIEPVRVLQPHLRQGISLMNGMSYRSTYTGAGMSIAICDTGIDYNHPMLGNGGFPNTKVIGGIDTGDGDNDPIDCQGHGTSCAGIAAGNLADTGDYIGGVAPAAKLYAVKISDGCSGSAYNDAMIAGWDWCVTHKNDDPNHPIMVISTSFGGDRHFGSCDTATPGMTAAAQAAVAAGITVFVSSGNDGYCDSISWPACISSVISVGAVWDASLGTLGSCLTLDSCASLSPYAGCSTGYIAWDPTAPDRVTSYSNVASFLDVFAPSHNAYTTMVGGGYDITFGGTSAACPYAAGAAAVVQEAAYTVQGSYLNPGQLRSLLADTGDLVTDPKVAVTKPRVNIGQAIEELGCSGQFLNIQSVGTAPLVLSSISKPDWAAITPTLSFPYTLDPGLSITLCVTVDCGDCPGAPLNDAIEIVSNATTNPVASVPITMDCCSMKTDLTGNCAVDGDDVLALAACAGGPNVDVGPACQVADFDGDEDVDSVDFALLQRCLCPAGETPPAECLD